MTKTKTDKV